MVSHKKAEVCLGYVLDPETWDDDKQRSKKDKKINEELTFIENKILQMKRDLVFAGKPISARILKDIYLGKTEAYNTLVKYYEVYIRKLKSIPGHSETMAGKHQNALNKIIAYLASLQKSDILITEVNYRWIQDFDNFLLSCINTSINKPIGRSTANKQHARLKTIIDECVSEGILKSDPYEKVKFKSVKSTRSYLTSEELDLIVKHDLGNNLSLIKVRDVFVFSVYTGLRYIDAMALKIENVYVDKNMAYWIQLKQGKTEEGLHIPLLKQSLDIYNKYV